MFAKIVILCLLSCVVTQRHPAGFDIYDKSAGERCGRNNQGVCTLIINCPEAMEKVKARLPHGLEKCGFQGINEIVCCNSVSRNSRTAAACRKYYKEYDDKKSVRFIIEGEDAKLGEFPYAAALGYPDTRGEVVVSNGTRWKCGGTLISESYILTAAHCIDTAEGTQKPKIVRLGKIDIEGNEDKVLGQDIPVSEVKVHPKHNLITRQNDIALLKLKWPANFTDYVKPVCLSTDDNIPRDLVIIGWGYMQPRSDITSRFLQKAHTTLHDPNKCSEKYSNRVKNNLSTTQFCALSDEPEDGKLRPDSCGADSGGPILFENTQDNGVTPTVVVGIVSYGIGCGGSTPSVYTKVSKFTDWIEDIVWPLA